MYANSFMFPGQQPSDPGGIPNAMWFPPLPHMPGALPPLLWDPLVMGASFPAINTLPGMGGPRQPPPITTAMLRNIPNKYTREMLLEQLNRHGLRGTYDFLYLPYDFSRNCNLGYAFINFRNSYFYHHFRSVFEGHQLPGFLSAKICQVVPAKIQGYGSNILHFRNSKILLEEDDEHRPLMFGTSGEPIEFPPPCLPVGKFLEEQS